MLERTPKESVRFGKSVAEVVSKEAQRTQMPNEDHPQDWPVPGAQRRERESKGRRAHRLDRPGGAPALRRLVLGLSRVTFSADFLGWHEQSLNGERGPGPSSGRQPSGSPISQGPGGYALHRHHSQFPRIQGRQRNGGGDSYSKADVREWRFLSWLHLKSLGNFEQGTELLWASVSPYVRWRERPSLCWKESNI